METVITTNPAGPMLIDLAATVSNTAGVEGMQTILRPKMSAYRAVNQILV